MNAVYLAASTPASTDMDIILLLDTDDDDDGDDEEERPAIALKKLPPAAAAPRLAVRVVMPSTDAAPTTTPNRLVLSPLLHMAARRMWRKLVTAGAHACQVYRRKMADIGGGLVSSSWRQPSWLHELQHWSATALEQRGECRVMLHRVCVRDVGEGVPAVLYGRSLTCVAGGIMCSALAVVCLAAVCPSACLSFSLPLSHMRTHKHLAVKQFNSCLTRDTHSLSSTRTIASCSSQGQNSSIASSSPTKLFSHQANTPPIHSPQPFGWLSLAG